MSIRIIDSSAACSPTRGFFFVVEHMPSIIQPLQELENRLTQKVKFTSEERNVEGDLYIQCMVNCEGYPGDYQLIKCRDELYGVGTQLIEVFRNETIKWKPGIQRGVKVDDFMIIKAGVKNGRMKITVVEP